MSTVISKKANYFLGFLRFIARIVTVQVQKNEPEQVYKPEPEPVYVPETVSEPEYEMASEDDGIRKSSGLSTTQAMDSFNSLPESVRRMIMDADSESDY